MNKKLALWCVLSLLLPMLMGGCQLKRIINHDGFIQTVTIDQVKGEPNMYYYGITYPEFTAGGKSKTISLGVRAHDFQEAYLHFSSQTRYALVLGQIRNVVFGESVWRNDMKSALEKLNFQPKFPLTGRIMVVKGEARKLLELTEDTTDFHLYHLTIKLQQTNDFSLSTLFNYIRDYIQPGIEPVATNIRVVEDSLSVSGLAVFSGNKLAGIINENDVNYMSLLRNQKSKGYFHISDESLGGGNTSIIINNAHSRSKVKVLQTKPLPKVVIDVHITSTLSTTFNELQRDVDEYEARIAQALERQINRVIKDLQKMKSDTIGIGMHVRNNMPYKEWNEEEWPEMFSKADIECKIHYRLENMF
ncbi:Ger(x)C family spore germination protein [Paenibacillus marinisediminis]